MKNNSLVVTVSYVKHKFLFWGDFTFECQVEAYSKFPLMISFIYKHDA